MPRKANLSRLASDLHRHSAGDLEMLKDAIATELDRRVQDAKRVDAESAALSSGGWAQEYRRCGSKGCHCQKDGDRGHGPYWYRTYRNEQGKVRKEYRRKNA